MCECVCAELCVYAGLRVYVCVCVRVCAGLGACLYAGVYVRDCECVCAGLLIYIILFMRYISHAHSHTHTRTSGTLTRISSHTRTPVRMYKAQIHSISCVNSSQCDVGLDKGEVVRI